MALRKSAIGTHRPRLDRKAHTIQKASANSTPNTTALVPIKFFVNRAISLAVLRLESLQNASIQLIADNGTEAWEVKITAITQTGTTQYTADCKDNGVSELTLDVTEMDLLRATIYDYLIDKLREEASIKVSIDQIDEGRIIPLWEGQCQKGSAKIVEQDT